MLALGTETITKTLWTPKPGQSLTKQSGECLHIGLRGHKGHFSCIAVHALDEKKIAVATTDGYVYGVSLAENKLFLLADTSGIPVRAIALCDAVHSPIAVFVLEGNELRFVDWHSGRMMYATSLVGAHARPVTRIVTAGTSTMGQRAPMTFACMSADAISCWARTTIATQDGDGPRFPSSAPKVISDQSTVPYFCTGTTIPVQCALILGTNHVDVTNSTPAVPPATNSGSTPPQNSTEDGVANHHNGRSTANTLKQRGKELEAHRFMSIAINHDSLITTETNGVVALWKWSERDCGGTAVLRPLVLSHCVRTLPFCAATSAMCGACVVLGSRDDASVAFLKSDTLEGICVIGLPLSNPVGATCISGKTSVTQLSIIGESNEVLACGLSDGRVVFVAMQSHQVAFQVTAPALVERRFHDDQFAWQFYNAGGATFGLLWSDMDACFFHLPTAKADYEARMEAMALEGECCEMIDATGSVVVKAAPFLRTHPKPSGSHPKANPQDVASQLCRTALVLDKQTVGKWVDVNSAAASSSTDASVAITDQRMLSSLFANAAYTDTLSKVGAAFNMEKLREHLTKYGSFPSKFRPVVWRFVLGLPHKRTTVSQFAALARRGPHPAVTRHMSRFPLPPGPVRVAVETALSVLAWHAPVLAVAPFMPAYVFPLVHVFGPNDVQGVVEMLLAYLRNWGRDYFTCYPLGPAALLAFMQHALSAEDAELAAHFESIGATAEVWCWSLIQMFYTDLLTGPEWLQVMDHVLMMEPMWLYLFHIRLLIPLRSVLLECGSAAEMLEQLGRPHPDIINVARVIQATHAYRRRLRCSTRGVSGDSATAEFLHPYFAFRSFGKSQEYPRELCGEEAGQLEVAQRVSREVEVMISNKEEHARARRELAQARQQAEAQSLKDVAAIEEQRARLTAKYDASVDQWRARVAKEAQLQALEVECAEVRLHTVLERNARAKELEALQSTADMLGRQHGHGRVDQLREERKWNLAADLTGAELERLERDAEARVATALLSLSSGGGIDNTKRSATSTSSSSAIPLRDVQQQQQQSTSKPSPLEESSSSDKRSVEEVLVDTTPTVLGDPQLLRTPDEQQVAVAPQSAADKASNVAFFAPPKLPDPQLRPSPPPSAIPVPRSPPRQQQQQQQPASDAVSAVANALQQKYRDLQRHVRRPPSSWTTTTSSSQSSTHEDAVTTTSAPASSLFDNLVGEGAGSGNSRAVEPRPGVRPVSSTIARTASSSSSSAYYDSPSQARLARVNLSPSVRTAATRDGGSSVGEVLQRPPSRDDYYLLQRKYA